MNILLIDTSSKKLKILLKKGGEVFYHEDADALTHSVSLLPSLQKLLTEAELNACEIDYASSIIGPGSFTGLRIGAATLKGLFFGKKTQLFTLTSLELLSYAAKGLPCYCLVSDVGGWHYFAAYDKYKKELIPPSAMRTEDIKAVLECVSSKAVFIGDAFDFINPNLVQIEPEFKYLMKIATENIRQEQFVDMAAFELLYLRKPQAEGG